MGVFTYDGLAYHLDDWLQAQVDKKRADKIIEEIVGPKGCGKFARMPRIDKVIFNPPATIVLWSDGTKTVVKAKMTGKKKEQDEFSEETGLAMAIAKRYFGSRSGFRKAVKNAKRCGDGERSVSV